MQKILYLLLLISVASFGQSGTGKLNINNDSIYKPVCFTLNDSASAFKYREYSCSGVDCRYEYKVQTNKKYNDTSYIAAVAIEEPMLLSDSNTLELFVQRQKRKIAKEDTSVNIKMSITDITGNYNVYQLEVSGKIKAKEVEAKAYFIKCKNKVVTLAFGMLPSISFDFYLQEFNKLVNTIQFK